MSSQINFTSKPWDWDIKEWSRGPGQACSMNIHSIFDGHASAIKSVLEGQQDKQQLQRPTPRLQQWTSSDKLSNTVYFKYTPAFSEYKLTVIYYSCITPMFSIAYEDHILGKNNSEQKQTQTEVSSNVFWPQGNQQ